MFGNGSSEDELPKSWKTFEVGFFGGFKDLWLPHLLHLNVHWLSRPVKLLFQEDSTEDVVHCLNFSSSFKVDEVRRLYGSKEKCKYLWNTVLNLQVTPG